MYDLHLITLIWFILLYYIVRRPIYLGWEWINKKKKKKTRIPSQYSTRRPGISNSAYQYHKYINYLVITMYMRSL